MNSSNVETTSVVRRLESDAGERRRVMWVFVQWCLRREALNPWNYLEILFPLSVAGIVSWRELSFRWYPGQGTALLRILFGISASFIFVGGVRHASKAVCWEVSREQRDLVRLTGIEPNIG